MQNLTLIACAALKLDYSAPARDLYISPLFRFARRYAEANDDRFFILSALHGLVEPETILAPYNVKLSDYTKREREQWTRHVLNKLRASAPKGTHIIILAGRLYRDGLEHQLQSEGYTVDVPLRGLGLGKQIQFLKKACRDIKS